MANLLHIKGSRTQIYKTLPSSSVGNDGDIILSQIQGRGVYLCSKVNGKWHVSNKMEELRKIEKTSIKDLKLDRVRLGNTTITKDEYDVSSGDFTLDVAGNIILEATTSINSNTPLKIKEAAAAVADTIAYGQLWVKTATPNELYFTTDAGNDIQLTSGTTTATTGTVTSVGTTGTVNGVTLTGTVTSSGNLTLGGTLAINNGDWSGTDLAIANGGTGASNSNDWLNSRITTNANGSLNYDATGATAVNHDSLTGFVAAEHVDWAGASAGTIHASNYVDNNTNQLTTFTVSATTDSNATTISQGDDLMFTAGTGITCETTADGTVTITNTVSAPTNYVTNDANDTMAGTLAITSTTADQFKVLYDASNYALLNVSATGDLEIETIGAGTTDSDITLNADGDIELNADGGQVNIKDDSASHFLFDCDSTRFRIFDDANANDHFTIAVGAEGVTTLTTVDADTTAGHLTLAPDGDLILNPKEGKFIAQKDGTEFSAADSAYAGMILGYTRIANDGTGSGDPYISMDATLTVLQTVDASTNVSIAFVAPPSGNIEIVFSCSLYASSKTVEFALSDNSTYNEISETHTYDGGAQSSDETDINMTVVSWAVTGLTAGTSYTYYIAGAETISGTAFIKHGRFRSSGTHFPPIIVKAIALPATIVTGG